MLDTLHETENGAALAANQVGVLKRLVVIDFGNGNYSAYLAEKAVSVLAFDYSEKWWNWQKSAKNGMLITLSFV